MSGSISETATSFWFGDGFSFTSSPAGNDWNFMHFTDDTHDFEDNLEHTWFRQYSSTLGRFMTTDPDPGSMDVGNPQSLNRYAYGLNDPVDYVDPTGLDVGPGSGGAGGPFAASGCTLIDGGPDEAFGCADLFGGSFNTGSGFSFNLFGPGFGGLGGSFGGIPLPGCFLPGACNIPLPSLSQQIDQWLSGVLPNTGCNSATVIIENCTPASTDGFVSAPPIPWQGIGIAAEQGLLRFLGVLGGLLFLTGDNVPHPMSKGGTQNVADTGVLDQAQQMVASGQATDLCDALKKM